MEPTKQGAADDLDAALQAMGLFTTTPTRPLPPFPAPASLMLPGLLQPTPRGHARPLQGARQYWPQPPLQGYREDEGSHSQGAGYVSAAGSCFPSSVYASHLGVLGPRFDAPAVPAAQLVVPKSSELSGSEYRPSVVQSSTTLCADAKPYRPTTPARRTVVSSSSTPSSSDIALPDASHRQPTLEEKMADLIRQLEEGSEAARLMVLAWVKHNVHRVMASAKGHVVFLALLRACEGRLDELKGIAEAAAVSNGNGLVMMVKEQSHGYTVVQFAISTFDDLCLSVSGLKCLEECFQIARNGDLEELEEMTLSRTSLIAKSDFWFQFLKRLVPCGSKHFKERFVERVLEDIMSLSMHHNEHHAVLECFVWMGPALLQRMIAVFTGLSDDRLAELVQDRHGCCVVNKLLMAGKDHFPEQTTTLARQIEKLLAARGP
ncbi:hypothetical protein QOZ80_3AG0237070 [Eleusine coracana subsp. coracana]|nr:hypothetical protein QOZ80_3AG0237070 [Eleusine coracana subsp. coracana]